MQSHPVWVCGLKPLVDVMLAVVLYVTPCMGVWIETSYRAQRCCTRQVTPCMGVWIETCPSPTKFLSDLVTPCMGVWIETGKRRGG